MMRGFVLFSLLVSYSLVFVTSFEDGEDPLPQPQSNISIVEDPFPKLLVLLIDGWDYFDRQIHQLPAFRQLIAEGVRAKYVEPIFPSLSYPSWTTLTTGLYPSSHNIIGNYMLHLGSNEYPETIFHLKDNSTKLPFWWKSGEPIWTTLTKAGRKSYLTNFANCDVPYEGYLPTECTGYSYKDVNVQLREHLNKALFRFKQGYSLAMIYDDSIDHAGHTWGPDSNELRLSVVYVDTLLRELFNNMRAQGLIDKVNLVITSDHGMTNIKQDTGMQFVKLSDYVDTNDIYKVIDYGAVVSICSSEGKTDSIYTQLLMMPGVDIYKKQDIPDEFHIKESQFMQDILLVARPGFFIVGIKGDKQIPSDSKASMVQPYAGSHGYHNIADMRTVFLARGPAFKRGMLHSAFRLEDEYQILMEVLDLEPCPNNGTWENVKELFADQTYESAIITANVSDNEDYQTTRSLA